MKVKQVKCPCGGRDDCWACNGTGIRYRAPDGSLYPDLDDIGPPDLLGELVEDD